MLPAVLLIDLLAEAPNGLGRTLPFATIADDTRYVLRRAPTGSLVFRAMLEDSVDPRVERRDADVPHSLSLQKRLVVQPRVMLEGGEWIPSQESVVEVSGGLPRRVAFDVNVPANPRRRPVQLTVKAIGTRSPPLEEIAVGPVLVPADAELRFSVGLLDAGIPSATGLFALEACVVEGCHTLFREKVDPATPAGSGWLDRRVDLGRFSGREVTFRFTALRSSPGEAVFLPLWANPTVFAEALRSPSQRNVILLSIDTLRADHMTSHGYEFDTTPFIDERFADGGAVFDEMVAAATVTTPTHATILTGVDVATHRTFDGFKRIPDSIPMLAELARAGGFETASYNENGWMRIHGGFSRGFDRYVENKSPHLSIPSGQVDRTFDGAIAWLRENRDTPFFLFLHTYQVHTPYAPPPKYVGLFGRSERDPETGEVPEALAMMADYDREIRYTDDELRRFFEVIDELDLARDTVFVLTSDHGEAFMEHGLLEHGSRLDQSVLHVPLMLWGDSVPAGRRVSANVGQIDVLPTILDFMGVEAPREIQGLSLRPLLAVDDATPGAFAQRPLFSEARAPFGIQTGNRAVAVQTPGLSVRLGAMKLVRYTNADGEFIYEFYDVASDPGDEVDLAPGRGDQWKELALLLSQHQEASDRFRTRLEGGGAIESQAAPLDPEHEAKLRALGYIE